MLTLKNVPTQRIFQISLTSGIALIVISMLAMGRGQESSSFIEQAASVLAVPAFFYVIGFLVYRYLKAPLAAPGFVATGAWLIGVGLIHLYDKRTLMPGALQPYYWLTASLLAAALITVTGHRVRTPLIVPLVPLAQANALWAVLLSLGLRAEWFPSLTFLLVLGWLELPLKEARWRSIYRASAIVLGALLLIFTIWLPASTAQSQMVTWGMCAAVVAIVGLQYGWLSLGPLAIVMLTGASIWGLPANWWSIAWLLFSVVTLVLMEGMASPEEDGQTTRAVGLSRGLAVLLSGGAAVFAQGAPLFSVVIHPLLVAGILLVAGVLLIWLGLRWGLLIATHGGLWMLVAAWIDLYFVAIPSSGTYGLWLALFAVCALLVQRLAASRAKEKRKAPLTIVKTMTSWPVADMAIGVSTYVLLWTAQQIGTIEPGILTVTFAVIIGIWITTGLLYRLPILLHIALWVAPIPYALLLILLAPLFWTVPLMGIAWQLLGVTLLVLGHSAPRYRPQLLAPFFIVGYFLLGFGFTIAIANPLLMPVSLTIVVITSTLTSAAVILNYHPAWTVFVQWLIQPEKRPYAFRHVHQLFLFFSAWIAAVWLHLMLGYTGLSLPRQGICLVLFACVWFILGRVLGRFPKAVTWPIIGAGWFMWLIGLLEVFFSPPEALITVILGLAISGEALRRTREVFWVPVLILQVLFTALQVAWLLALPGYSVLLLVAVAISVAGMAYEKRQSPKAGRVAAITGAILAMGLWAVYPNLSATLLLTLLPVAAATIYRNWRWLWIVYAGLGVAAFQSRIHVDWRELMIAGAAQWIVGAELMTRLRPRRFRTFNRAFFLERDWATPFLWIAPLFVVVGLIVSLQQASIELVLVSAVLAVFFAVYTNRLRIFFLSYFSLILIGFGLLVIFALMKPLEYSPNADGVLVLIMGITMDAILIRWLCVRAITAKTLLRRARWLVLWLKPLLATAYLLAGASAVILFATSGSNFVSPALQIVDGVLLAIFTGLLYFQRRELTWLCISFGEAAWSWLIALQLFHLHNSAWITLPLGVVLFGVARVSRSRTLEMAGTLVWFGGTFLSLDRSHLVSPASLGAALHFASLLGYGLLGGRRIPFAGGALLLVGGIVLAITRINIWLIPFAGGSLLLAITLFLEVRRETAERWISEGLTRWQQWK